jgi:hypothetical protein
MTRNPLALVVPLLTVLGLAGCAPPGDASAAGPNTPGWTGRTVVVGNTSTVAGNAEATYQQQKWQLNRGR